MRVVTHIPAGGLKQLTFYPETDQDVVDLRAMVNRAANCWELRPKWLEKLVDTLALPYRKG